MLNIKVLGTGCSNCNKLEETVKKSLADFGVEGEVEKVTDYGDIMAYGVLATPGLVVNDKLVASGRVPSQAEVSTWIADAMMG